jgi:hypothetical protein
MKGNPTRSHENYQADIPEYVLGVLDGRARAELLAHLEGCEECSDEVQSLAVTADALLYVPVGAEPPIGFESRVLQRIAAKDSTPRRRTGWLLAAAVAILIASSGIGWAVSHASAPSQPSQSAAGPFEQHYLSADGNHVGLVYAYAGSPAWMFVDVDAPNAPSSVRCVVITKSGTQDLIGNFALTNGKGAWGAALPVSFSSVRNVELTSPSGTVIAAFSPSSWSSSSKQWTD